jgi:signal transduction histidine kinase
MAKQSERSGEMALKALARAAAHDLKGPLNRISGFTELLQRNFGIVLRSAQQMNRLIDDLSDYVRVISQDVSQDGAFLSVDLNEIVSAAKLQLHELISERSAKVSTFSLPTLPGSPDALLRLLVEIIKNGITHNRSPNPEINISALSDGKEHIISISDNGVGIDEKNVDKIFEPLISLDRDNSQSGLGLAVASHIVERHKGTIKVNTNAEQGAEITLTFPI